ncbi:hypothetical protein OG562_12255 [Streptomyces sp. NBC_01275]|uniref:hypothetical protein n=1 Tax=Streptomyces sp. NBC_01275 TaxID=2903807 RepID=UPI002258709C|nr:hypothetical protein [Streptomyces sp. NBC_01275]MCX4761734.1 hypothetical protein [Streptomyces sp. NBC_01275]
MPDEPLPNRVPHAHELTVDDIAHLANLGACIRSARGYLAMQDALDCALRAAFRHRQDGVNWSAIGGVHLPQDGGGLCGLCIDYAELCVQIARTRFPPRLVILDVCDSAALSGPHPDCPPPEAHGATERNFL